MPDVQVLIISFLFFSQPLTTLHYEQPKGIKKKRKNKLPVLCIKFEKIQMLTTRNYCSTKIWLIHGGNRKHSNEQHSCLFPGNNSSKDNLICVQKHAEQNRQGCEANFCNRLTYKRRDCLTFIHVQSDIHLLWEKRDDIKRGENGNKWRTDEDGIKGQTKE